MKTTVILNLKGGVGKTTTVINMAALLASEHGKRVLVIDADHQCNATEFLGGDPRIGNLADVLRYPHDGGFDCATSIQHSNIEGVDLLAGSDGLMDLDLTTASIGKAHISNLQEGLMVLAERDMYDHVLIDCPPAFNAASAAALAAGDEVIIPIKLDAFSLRGMANLLQQVVNMRAINPHIRIAGVLPTMFYRSSRTDDAIHTLEEHGFAVLYPIRASRTVDEMTYKQEPLRISSPHSGAGIDYRNFIEDFLGGGLDE